MTPDDTATSLATARLTPEESARLASGFQILARVENQLHFADGKAAFVASLHAFLGGPLAANVAGIREVVANWSGRAHFVLWFCVAIYALLFMVSMTFVTLTVMPRTRRSSRAPSKAYFGRIASDYGGDPARFIAELRLLSEEDWLGEIGQYIVDASTIAAAKHRMARLAIVFAVPTVAAWMLVALVLIVAGR